MESTARSLMESLPGSLAEYRTGCHGDLLDESRDRLRGPSTDPAIHQGLATFDAAVCRLGLMFCPAPLQALRAMQRALVPGGRLAVLVFSGPATNPCVATLMRTAQQHAGAVAGDPFAPGTLLSLGRPGLLAQLIAEAGFDAVEVRPLAAPFRVPHCADYMEFVRSSASPVIAMLKPLPAAARDAAWTQIAAQLDAYSTPDGWVGPNELLLGSAVKRDR